MACSTTIFISTILSTIFRISAIPGFTDNSPRATSISPLAPASGKTRDPHIVCRKFFQTKEFATRSIIGVPWAATTGPTGNTKCANTSPSSFNGSKLSQRVCLERLSRAIRSDVAVCAQPFAPPAAILPSLLYALLSLRLRRATSGPALSPRHVSAAIARTSTRSTCFLFSVRFEPRANASPRLLVSLTAPSPSLVPPVFAPAWWRGQISEAATSHPHVALSIDRLQLLAALTVLRFFPRAHDESLRVQPLPPEQLALYLLLY